MWNFKLALALLLLLCTIASCNSEKEVYDNIMQMKSKPITLSCDSMRLISYKNRVDTLSKQFYWIVYSDSVDCSSCRLSNLVYWNDFIYEIKKKTNHVGFRFIFSPSKSDIGAFMCTARNINVSSQVYLDSANVFARQNQHIPNDVLYHTFLLDQNLNVILVGDPVRNKKIYDFFWTILSDKECSSNNQ